MSEIAEQGIHQRGFIDGKQALILHPGETFTSIDFPNRAKELEIPKGCIGITHSNTLGVVEEISVVRDDCKAARKALLQEKRF